ncbi:MAG: Uma2 family endonuclease [Verrucomicrobiales bacterium]|jgi:Uma2 family endonuclease
MQHKIHSLSRSRNSSRGERLTEERHEYMAVQVYAIAGASKNHERVSGFLFATMLQHLRGEPCEVFKSDMKVNVEVMDATIFYYPDIVVSCDPSRKREPLLNRPKVDRRSAV